MHKAQKRLTSLQNGGPVEESDADSNDLNADKTSDTDTSSSGDELAMNGSLNGTYLAAVIRPVLASAMLDNAAAESEVAEQQEVSSAGAEDAGADVDFGSGDTDGDNTEVTPSPEPTETPDLTPTPEVSNGNARNAG